MIFTPELALSEEQFARIGRIHVTWANIEKALQLITSRMAMGPDWPTGALTDSLIFESRLKALDALVEIHTKQLANKFVSAALCDKVRTFRKSLANNREMRNRLAHWMIFRIADDVAASRVATRLSSPDRIDDVRYTTADLNAHIVALSGIMAMAQQLLSELPQRPGPFDDKPPGK